MHDRVSFNGRLTPAESASISALSAAALFARGVFTTIAIFAGKPFLWNKHWKRLAYGCSRLGIASADVEESTLERALIELIETNGVDRGRARITIFDEAATELWPVERSKGPSILITTADARTPPSPFLITFSPHRLNSTSPLVGIKSLNYTDRLLALAEARGRDFHECVQLNESEKVVSAAMANIFWEANGNLFTPALATGCLAGTTREHVIESLDVSEVTVGIEELVAADQIFLTSAGLGIVAAGGVDGRQMDTSRHRILDLIPPS